MVTIQSVEKKSLADRAGIRAGDILISINGNNISDVLDYRFYLVSKSLSLLIHRGPELLPFEIRKKEYDDIGLEFETYLNGQKIHHDDIAKGISEILHKSIGEAIKDMRIVL